MSDTTMKVQILIRTELALARMRTQRTFVQSAWAAVAVIFVLVALVMLNIAAYQFLTVSQGPARAALFVALGDVVLALLVLVIGRLAGRPSANEKLALEMRDLAQTEINRDIETTKAEIGQITSNVRNLTAGVASATSLSLHTIVPLLGLILKLFRRK